MTRSQEYKGRTLRRVALCIAGLSCVFVVPNGALARKLHPHVKKHRTRPTHVVRLSNETTYTRYSIANSQAKIFARPNSHSRVITRLQDFTPDQEALQTYLLLKKERIGRRTWVRLRVPMRPNGRTGWVPRRALGPFWTVHSQIVVDRETFTLTVYLHGKQVFTTRVGVGRPSLPTPAGHFWVTETFRSTDPAYGPWAFGTSDYATLQTGFADGSMVGIHGTDMPWLIPGRPSHGCIRLHDSAVLQLKQYIEIGTPILVK